MGKFNFLDDWKEDKQYDVFLELRTKLKDRLEKQEAVPPKPINLTKSFEESQIKREIKGLMTGYDLIDDPELLGGLQNGSVYVIGGLTGVGKTLLTCNIVIGVCRKQEIKTLFITTEMPHYTVTPRLLTIWNFSTDKKDGFLNLPIEFIDQRETISTELIETVLQEQLTDKNPYRFLVIDNLQWFTRGGVNVPESIGIAMQAIKKMAIKYDLPIVVVSHLNRETYKQNGPEINNLKGGSYIEQDADGIILISRSAKIDNDDEFADNVIIATLRKNRLTGKPAQSYLKSGNDGDISLKEVEKWEAQLR